MKNMKPDALIRLTNLWLPMLLLSISMAACNSTGNSEVNYTYDQSSKGPSESTTLLFEDLEASLPFDDEASFIRARDSGFIAAPTQKIIYRENPADGISYSMDTFAFITGDNPPTVNPSLWRQSELTSKPGLYKVRDGIYQIRGFDLANMSLIETDGKWIVIDPLTVKETAKAAMEFVDQQLGIKRIEAVIFTHSHLDHFGGIRSLQEREEAAGNSGFTIVAPKEFFEHSVSENVMAGSAMGRRAAYMYGNLIEVDERGTVGSGLGSTKAEGIFGIDRPTITIQNDTSLTLGSTNIELYYTPESEAPSEMMFYFTDMKAFCQSENINHTLHNLYTLRGAKVRDGLKWSTYIDKAIVKYGAEVEVSFGSHHWPTWYNDKINKFWAQQRDMYRYLHDQALRTANRGQTPREIAEEVKLPDSLAANFSNRDYYGTVKHDLKAQYQLYFGWFDGNPANLDPLPPVEAAIEYVRYMGGSSNILSNAITDFDDGKYRWVAEVLNHLVYAEPGNNEAKYLLADTYEQMGYQAESGPWRNFYLTGAKELRYGVTDTTGALLSEDFVNGMTVQLLFDFLSMHFQGSEDNNSTLNYHFTFHISEVPEIGNETTALVVSNGASTPRIGSGNLGKPQEGATQATINLNMDVLRGICLGVIDDSNIASNPNVTILGDSNAFLNFLSKLDDTSYWFNIVTP